MAYNLSKPIHERVQTFCEGGSIYLGCLSTKMKVYLIGDDSEKEIQYFELVNGFHQTPRTPFHCKYSIFASRVCEETTFCFSSLSLSHSLHILIACQTRALQVFKGEGGYVHCILQSGMHVKIELLRSSRAKVAYVHNSQECAVACCEDGSCLVASE